MTSPLEWQTDLAELEVPPWVRQITGEGDVRPVWRNEDGGITYAVGHGRTFLKAQRPGLDWQPAEERARLQWVAQYVSAPRLLRHGRHGDLHWLLTTGLPGRSAVARPWRDLPDRAVPELGRALRRFHDVVPAADCPFDWSVHTRVTHYDLPPEFLDHIPQLDAVVCHGDACNPNTLLDDNGTCSGYVDLGGLGVADRWADLAPALKSLTWNYGPGWDTTFLAAYGIESDPAKLAFYTALWDGVSANLGRF